MKKKENDINFEDAMNDLEQIVETLEKGELPLDKSLEEFKKGVELSNHCEKLLSEAEKSITILLKNKDGEIEEQEFNVEA